MNQQPISLLYSKDRKRRIAIFRRNDEYFGTFEQYHFINDAAGIEGWASLPPHPSIYEGLEVAKRESIFSVPWAIDEGGFIGVKEDS